MCVCQNHLWVLALTYASFSLLFNRTKQFGGDYTIRDWLVGWFPGGIGYATGWFVGCYPIRDWTLVVVTVFGFGLQWFDGYVTVAVVVFVGAVGTIGFEPQCPNGDTGWHDDDNEEIGICAAGFQWLYGYNPVVVGRLG